MIRGWVLMWFACVAALFDEVDVVSITRSCVFVCACETWYFSSVVLAIITTAAVPACVCLPRVLSFVFEKVYEVVVWGYRNFFLFLQVSQDGGSGWDKQGR